MGRTEGNITGEQEIGEPTDGEALQISLGEGSMDGYNSEIYKTSAIWQFLA